ncbi:MAG: winged helix-turn-helix domain-containing protein [Candidatus Hodarchaeales archaeon]
MKDENKDDIVEDTLLNYNKQISRLVKAIASDKRITILGYLMKGSSEFRDLKKKTGIEKTALANHLTKLLDSGLIEKVGHGEYSITNDGKDIASAIAVMYDQSQAKKSRMQTRYTRWMMKMEEKIAKTKEEPVYQSCWISYLGSVAGVVKSLGKECDITTVGGYTGYSFMINVSNDQTCPSGPTSLGEWWNDIIEATTLLGWNIYSYDEKEEYSKMKSFPEKEGELTEKDIERAEKLYQLVKSSIDNDKPVVAWGLPIPEYGIIKGYKDHSYIVSTFRHLSNMREDPVRYDELQAPGCLHGIFFREKTGKEITSEDDKKAIERAIRMAEGVEKQQDNYVTGPEAFTRWADILEKGEEANVIYHGNSYVGECINEARAIAEIFIKRLVEKYTGRKQEQSLINAVEAYGEVSKQMAEFVKVFPFAMDGDLSTDKRKQGAEILRKAKEHELTAISFLKAAIDNWE